MAIVVVFYCENSEFEVWCFTLASMTLHLTPFYTIPPDDAFIPDIGNNLVWENECISFPILGANHWFMVQGLRPAGDVGWVRLTTEKSFLWLDQNQDLHSDTNFPSLSSNPFDDVSSLADEVVCLFLLLLFGS